MDAQVADPGAFRTVTRWPPSRKPWPDPIGICTFALLLIALLEAGGAGYIIVRTLLVILLVARLLHPIGLFAEKNSVRQFACRGGGMIGTLGVMLVAAVMLLIRMT